MKVTLAELEKVARDLGIKVTYDDIRTSKGGTCRVLETRRILVNKHLAATEKVILLARELGRFDLGGLDVPDRVRKKIQLESDRAAAPLGLTA
jgi:hypothetical protein